MGAAKAVAGIKASRKVEKRMVIDACDEVKRLAIYAHSVRRTLEKRKQIYILGFSKRLVDMSTSAYATQTLKYNVWGDALGRTAAASRRIGHTMALL